MKSVCIDVDCVLAEFKPPFSISKQQADYYRKTRAVNIEALKREGEGKALSTGLAIAGERVKVLKKLADLLMNDLFEEDLFWLLQVKGVGAGAAAEVVEYEEFNRGEVDTLLSVLDDIAKETGGRIQKSDVTSGGEPIEKAIDDERFDRGISTLALALRESLSGKGTK